MMMEQRRFSDFSNEPVALEGGKLAIDAIVNQEIEVLKYRLADSSYPKNKSGKYLTLQFNLDKQTHIVFTGSDVLARQCEQYQDELPFLTTIKKINRYYTMT
jgi:hypothetical protein